MRSTLITVAALITLSASTAGAQRSPRRPPGGAGGQSRAVLEQEFRARGDQLVRERLNLSGEQMQRLRDVNGRLDARRRGLADQERAARIALRQELARGSAADQAHVASLMSQARDLQQQRFELQKAEQSELSTFLTPVQQAQYFGLQAQLRQKMREIRDQQNQGPVTP
ncbi:MAG: hypothetical protein ACR2MQ_14055 [Gemmatimonadaceae bacterium]